MINKSSLIAIKALAELANLPPGKCEGAVSLAKKIDAPANYLSKTLQSMADRGLIVSQKGKGGGFRIDKDPSTISLFDVVEQVEDMGKWSKCFLGRKRCLDSSPCSMHERWKQVRETNIEFLKSIRLSEIKG